MITGSLISTEVSLEGVRVIELSCFQGAGQEALSGMSGAAVLVNRSCVGIIVHGPLDLGQRVLFAVPIAAVCEAARTSKDLDHVQRCELDRVITLEIDKYDECFSQYLSAVRVGSNRLPQLGTLPLGPSKRRMRSLDDVFVSPMVRRVKVGGNEQSAVDAQDISCSVDPDCPVLPLNEAVAAALKGSEPNIVFFGDPGIGKSSLLRHIAGRAWESPTSVGLEAPYIPMLVRLGNLAECEGTLEDWLWDGMCKGADAQPAECPPRGFFSKWAERTGSRWLLLLDGFDEIPEKARETMLGRLGDLLESDAHLCFLTSRPAQGREDPIWYLCNASTCYEVLPFSATQELGLVQRWLDADARRFQDQFEKIRLNASKKTPLLLTMAVAVYRADGDLGESRIGIYERFVEAALKEAHIKGLEKQTEPAVAELARPILEDLALRSTEARNLDVTSVIGFCTEYLERALRISSEHAEVKARRAVLALGRLSGLFFCDGETCQWWHNTIAEYLAACVLLNASRERLFALATRWDQDQWGGVVLFLLSLLGRPKTGAGRHKSAVTPKFTVTVRTPIPPFIDERFESLTMELAQHILEIAAPQNGVAALFLAAAWAEGAKLSWPLTANLIEHLRGSCLMAAEHDFCRQVYADLANSGRSPIDLLGRLAYEPEAATALLDMLRNRKLHYWARESAALACLRAGMYSDLIRLMDAEKLDPRLRKLISSRMPASLPSPSAN